MFYLTWKIGGNLKRRLYKRGLGYAVTDRQGRWANRSAIQTVTDLCMKCKIDLAVDGDQRRVAYCICRFDDMFLFAYPLLEDTDFDTRTFDDKYLFRWFRDRYGREV